MTKKRATKVAKRTMDDVGARFMTIRSAPTDEKGEPITNKGNPDVLPARFKGQEGGPNTLKGGPNTHPSGFPDEEAEVPAKEAAFTVQEGRSSNGSVVRAFVEDRPLLGPSCMRSAICTLILLAAATPGCIVRHVQTAVRLRDARDLRADLQEPGGAHVLVPPSDDGQVVPLAASEPDARAWIARSPQGSLVLHCAECVPDENELSEAIVIPGDPDGVLSWRQDGTLAIRYPYQARVPAGHGTWAQWEPFDVTLVTPRANVLDARRQTSIDREGRGLALGIGLGFIAVGLGFATDGALEAAGAMRQQWIRTSRASGDAAFIAGGLVFALVGAFWAGNALEAFLARDVDESVTPQE